MDHFRPKDFSHGRPWPEGPITLPESFLDHEFGADELRGLTEGLIELRDLILNYEDFINRDRTMTHERMSRRLGISDGTLRALRRGEQFPSWRVYVMLRAIVPSREVQEERLARGKFVPPKRPRE